MTDIPKELEYLETEILSCYQRITTLRSVLLTVSQETTVPLYMREACAGAVEADKIAGRRTQEEKNAR